MPNSKSSTRMTFTLAQSNMSVSRRRPRLESSAREHVGYWSRSANLCTKQLVHWAGIQSAAKSTAPSGGFTALVRACRAEQEEGSGYHRRIGVRTCTAA